MQQGRVLLDADWNEMQSIASRQSHLLVNDLVGNAAYPAQMPAFTPKVRGGLRFDGEKDFLLIENQSLDFSLRRHFSILASLSLSETGKDAVIFSQWNTLAQYDIETGIALGVSAEGCPYLQRTIATETRVEVEILASKVAIKFETDLQLAATFNGSSIRLYIDAEEVLCEFEPRIGLLEKGPVSIGAGLEARLPIRNMKGTLYDMAIFSRALMVGELAFNPFHHRRVGEIGLQAWWPFTEAEGEISRDISGNNNHAILGAGVGESMPTWLSPTLSFSAGRIYLDGVMAEQLSVVNFPLGKLHNGYFMAYVEIQQRLRSAVDDPSLLEPGLMGADTSVRMQTQLTMKRFPETATFASMDTMEHAWQVFEDAHQRVGQINIAELPRRAPLKSTLYRVQIVDNTDLRHNKNVSVVWSDDNSSLAYRVSHYDTDRLKVVGLTRSNRQLISGSYFSLLDREGHYLHAANTLLVVTEVDLAQGIVSYQGTLISQAKPVKLMQWQTDINHLTVASSGIELNIDDRLQLSFKPDAFYLKGDYWLIPTRAFDDTIEVEKNTWLSPFETRSPYQSVATFQVQDFAVWLQKDWRDVFVSAVQLDQFLRRSGGNMTGPLTLDETLFVEGDAQFNGNIILKGELSPQSIGTVQLKDHSVTHHKLARNLGLHLGQCVLSQNDTPPPGYAKVGNIMGDTEHATWQQSDNVLPLAGPFSAHNLGTNTVLLYGSGELFSVHKKVGRALIEYQKLAPFPGEAVRQFATSEMGDKLYVAGGQTDDGKKTHEFYCYDLNEDRWEKKADLAHPTSHMALCCWKGKVFAMGGMQTRFFGLLQHHPSRKLACYDPQLNSWEPLAPMPDDRYSGGAVAVNGLLHYLGGSDRELSGIWSESFCNSHYVYHPKDDRWHQALPIPLARSRFGILSLNDKIYCLGGRTGSGYTANVQVYNPETDYWEAEASLNVPRSHVAPVLLNEVIYALGGKRDENYIGFIENQNASAEFFVHRLESYLE